MLEQAISKRALAALDRVRKERGVRSRAKALEIVLLEISPDDTEILSAKEAKILESRIEEMRRGDVIPASEVFKRIGYVPTQ